MLAALPNQAEVARIGAEALAAWAHRLYAGPGYWNPLRPDLLAEQHLADTAQLPALAAAAARLAAGQDWEAGVLTQLLAELTRAAPNQPTVRAALDELLAAALPRIVDLAITTGPAELADLASLALQLAPRPDLAAPLADQMPEHSVRLAALAATLTSQQVTHYRAGASDGEPDTANRLAVVAEQPGGPAWATWGGGRRRWPRSRKPPSILRELAAARPDAFRPDLAMSLNNLAVGVAGLGRWEEALAAIREATEILPGAGRGAPGRVPPRPGQIAEQPVGPAEQPGAAGGGADRDPGSRHHPPGAGRGPPGRVPPRPGHVAEQPGGRPGRPGAAGGGADRDPGSHRASSGSWPRPARTRSAPTWPCR